MGKNSHGVDCQECVLSFGEELLRLQRAYRLPGGLVVRTLIQWVWLGAEIPHLLQALRRYPCYWSMATG